MNCKKILSVFLVLLILISGSGVPIAVSASEKFGDYTYEILNGTFCKILSYDGNETEIDMPEDLGGYIVQSLSAGLFKNNTLIKSVSLPYTLETVEKEIFLGCSTLESISFEDESGFPSKLTLISNSMFRNCTSLTEISLPDGIVSIGDNAFDCCSSLTKKSDRSHVVL